MLKIDLEQNGFAGLPSYIICDGFKVNIVDGMPLNIEYYYSIGVKGLDDKMIITNSFTKIYTDEDKRAIVDANGDEIMFEMKDEAGNPVYELDGITKVYEKHYVGVITYWYMGLGATHIFPDLHETLEGLALTHI